MQQKPSSAVQMSQTPKSQTFYRMAVDRHPVGYPFKATGRKYLGDEIEALIEAHKPAEFLSRAAATYLSASEDVSRMGLDYDEGYLHVVEPVGLVERRDAAWLGELQRRLPISAVHAVLPKDERLARFTNDEIAKNYVTGKPTLEPHWEHLASEAIVTAVDETPRRIRTHSPFLDAISKVAKSSD